MFGGFDRAMKRRFTDWTRFRLARVLKWIAFIVAVRRGRSGRSLDDLAGAWRCSRRPRCSWQALPMILQLAFAFFFIAFQFVGAVLVPVPRRRRHLLPRRHQDPLHRRLGPGPRGRSGSRRTSSSSRTRRRSRRKGGHVPGGILLWGPPGTGKTLMAEAVAGETGKPYVFVDPGAFINMFMGVGILKVKCAVPEAAQARAALRRRDRVLRRGRRARQPRRAGRDGARPGARRCDPGRSAHARLPRRSSTCREHTRVAARPRGDGPAAAPATAPRTAAAAAASSWVARCGGGGGMGTLQALLTELSGPEEAARLPQPPRAAAPWACGRSRRPSTASS